MLMDIKCSAITSICVNLTFDDHSHKTRVIGLGDLIAVEYNANGLRKRAEGKVICVSAVGADPKAWYIIVDSSDDFDSNKAKFSPMSILDVDVIRKADTLDLVRTPIGQDGVPYIRIRKGRLQYSKDGFDWHNIRLDSKDIIEDAEGTVPVNPPYFPPHHNTCTEDQPVTPDDGIEDANY